MHYESVDDLEEPLVRYVPDTTPLSLNGSDATSATLTLTPDASPLARSIAELTHGENRTRVFRGVALLGDYIYHIEDSSLVRVRGQDIFALNLTGRLSDGGARFARKMQCKVILIS